MKLSYFENGKGTRKREPGKIITVEDLIDIKYNGGLKFKNKHSLPSIQGQCGGYFMAKEDTMNFKFYEYWDGVCFVDIDRPKHKTINENGIYIEEVCEWWTSETIKNKLYDMALALVKYKWFKGIALSGGGHGWHILGYIKSRWHSETEYMATYIQIYNDVYSELLHMFNDKDPNEVRSMCDGHNIYPYQKFLVSGKDFIINNGHDETATLELNDYSNDEEYLINMKSNGNIYIVSQVIDQFNKKIISNRNVNINTSKIDNVNYNSKYIIKKKQPLFVDGVPYFNNVYRYMLVKTLKCFFNKEDTYSIAVSVYDKYWQEGHDKIAAHKHIEQLINNEDPFDIKDWFIDILIKIGIISERPIYDKLYDMDELGYNYLSEIMGDILADTGDITIIDSPVASGKTTSIKMINDVLWLCEPYNPVIKNNFDDLSSSFQCIYDDIQFDEEKFTVTRNKIASSYNKLINIDSEIFVNKKIKYLFIDESHTIFSDCSFRSEVMYNLVKKIIEIANLGVKVILMTGTPLKEKELFSSCSDLNVKYIKVKRKHKYKKTLKILTYEMARLNELTGKMKSTGFILEDYVADTIIDYKNKGYKILIPTNEGDSKINMIMNKVLVKSNYSICDNNFNIYKRDYRNEDINKRISMEGDMSNDIVFCTTYLSVGVSINNTDPACIIFIGNKFNAYQIEQYASRFRNTDITVLWFINKELTQCIKSPFRLFKIPSEEEINSVLESTKNELRYRGWENWDMILNRTINAYPGIIKENMFEMNELYYDKVSLYISWYDYSLNKYYDNFMNNKEELQKYSFDISEEDITKKINNKEYKDEVKEVAQKITNENAELILKWIDYINEYYFLQGRLEFNFEGESIYREPFISLHKFAMYCWYHYIDIDSIKGFLQSMILTKKRYKDNKYAKRYKESIEKAEKKICDLEENKNDKNYKRAIKTAEEKRDKYINMLDSLEETCYKIDMSNMEKIKALVKISVKFKDRKISKLFMYIKNEIDKKIKAKDFISYNKDDLLDELVDKYNKVCNSDNVNIIGYKKYKYELRAAIEKFINIMYMCSEKDEFIFIKHSYYSMMMLNNANWFNLVPERNFGPVVNKETRFMMENLVEYKDETAKF